MAVEDPLQAVPWPLLLAGASILIVVLFFRRRYDVFRDLGLSRAELAILCLGPVAGLTVNIPLHQSGGGILAVNLGGALLPLLMVALWLRRRRLDPVLAIGGTLVVSVVAKLIVVFDPQEGIFTTFPQMFFPSLVALAWAMAMSITRPLRAIPLAYASGSMGSLLGADLYNLGPILDHLGRTEGLAVVSIGGAGVFDMVYLSGMVAMASALVLLAGMLPKDREAGMRYPPALPAGPDPRVVWQRFLLLQDPNPRERARAALALSDLHLRARDYRGALAQGFLAVHLLLQAQPGLVERIRQEGSARLRADLDALLATWAQPPPEAALRRAAGNANHAAKLLASTLEPLLALPSRLPPEAP